MSTVSTWIVGLAALAVTWRLFRRVARPRGFLLLALGGVETLWFAWALSRWNARSWHNPAAVWRALLPLVLLDLLALLALARPRREPTSTRLLLLGWILVRVVIPGSLYLALDPSF